MPAAVIYHNFSYYTAWTLGVLIFSCSIGVHPFGNHEAGLYKLVEWVNVPNVRASVQIEASTGVFSCPALDISYACSSITSITCKEL